MSLILSPVYIQNIEEILRSDVLKYMSLILEHFEPFWVLFSKNGHNSRHENTIEIKSPIKYALIVLQMTVHYEGNPTIQT